MRTQSMKITSGRSLAAGLACAAAASLLARTARADEPLFGYVNTTDLLPAGKVQLEQWLTQRAGQARGRYSRLEARSEAEYGLKDNLQLSLYLNYDWTRASRNSVRGLTEDLGVRPGHDPNERYDRGRFDGVTGEAIWRLASPYLAPVGFAILGEATIGPDEAAARARAIVQKNFREDTLVLAGNLWVELEHRPAAAPGPPIRPKVTSLEFDAGASWRVRPNWSLALEYRRHVEYAGFGFGQAQSTADFLGPTLHYGGRRWFATLTAMRQVHGAAHTPALRPQVAGGLIYDGKHTRWDGLRIRTGRTF